jgi:hypothetical protein
MSTGSPVKNYLPNEPIPVRRIARDACYATVVFAVGVIASTVVSHISVLLIGPLSLFPSLMVDLYVGFIDVVRTAILVFSAFVALGIFLALSESRHGE